KSLRATQINLTRPLTNSEPFWGILNDSERFGHTARSFKPMASLRLCRHRICEMTYQQASKRDRRLDAGSPEGKHLYRIACPKRPEISSGMTSPHACGVRTPCGNLNGHLSIA